MHVESSQNKPVSQPEGTGTKKETPTSPPENQAREEVNRGRPNLDAKGVVRIISGAVSLGAGAAVCVVLAPLVVPLGIIGAGLGGIAGKMHALLKGDAQKETHGKIMTGAMIGSTITTGLAAGLIFGGIHLLSKRSDVAKAAPNQLDAAAKFLEQRGQGVVDSRGKADKLLAKLKDELANIKLDRQVIDLDRDNRGAVLRKQNVTDRELLRAENECQKLINEMQKQVGEESTSEEDSSLSQSVESEDLTSEVSESKSETLTGEESSESQSETLTSEEESSESSIDSSTEAKPKEPEIPIRELISQARENVKNKLQDQKMVHDSDAKKLIQEELEKLGNSDLKTAFKDEIQCKIDIINKKDLLEYSKKELEKAKAAEKNEVKIEVEDEDIFAELAAIVADSKADTLVQQKEKLIANLEKDLEGLESKLSREQGIVDEGLASERTQESKSILKPVGQEKETPEIDKNLTSKQLVRERNKLTNQFQKEFQEMQTTGDQSKRDILKENCEKLRQEIADIANKELALEQKELASKNPERKIRFEDEK